MKIGWESKFHKYHPEYVHPKDRPDRPYWAAYGFWEFAPHVFKQGGERESIVSAERVWSHLRENLRRCREAA